MNYRDKKSLDRKQIIVAEETQLKLWIDHTAGLDELFDRAKIGNLQPNAVLGLKWDEFEGACEESDLILNDFLDGPDSGCPVLAHLITFRANKKVNTSLVASQLVASGKYRQPTVPEFIEFITQHKKEFDKSRLLTFIGLDRFGSKRSVVLAAVNVGNVTYVNVCRMTGRKRGDKFLFINPLPI